MIQETSAVQLSTSLEYSDSKDDLRRYVVYAETFDCTSYQVTHVIAHGA